MSATRNSPAIGINLRALPLSAVTASLHYLPRRLCSIVTVHAAKRLPSWLELHLRRFVAMLLLRNKGH